MAKINKGDVAEGILSAALMARFIYRGRPISNNNVDAILRLLKNNKNLIILSQRAKLDEDHDDPVLVERRILIRAANKNRKLDKDNVSCSIKLNKSNMEALIDKEYRDQNMKPILNAAIQYANQAFLQKFVKDLYENNVVNNIDILSAGAVDQKTSKSDVNLIIDGKNIKNISVKTSSTQFGQVNGAKYENMVSLFEPLGIKFSPSDREKIENLAQRKKYLKVIEFTFKEATKQMKDLYKKNRIEFLKKLSEFIFHHATLKQKDIEMVKLNANKAKVFKFDKTYKNMEDLNLKISLSGESTLPTILIQNERQKKFLGIRCKVLMATDRKDGSKYPKVNTLIESGALFDSFLRNTYER